MFWKRTLMIFREYVVLESKQQPGSKLPADIRRGDGHESWSTWQKGRCPGNSTQLHLMPNSKPFCGHGVRLSIAPNSMKMGYTDAALGERNRG